MEGTTIRNCANLCDIQGLGSGGLVGYLDGTIENCYNVGTAVDPLYGVNAASAVTTNCFYLSETETDDGGRTASQFASGQVAYALNGSVTEETSVWRQTIGTDAYPMLSGPLVYYGTPHSCDGTALEPIYSNTPVDESNPPHSYENGFCTVCGGYEAPELADGVYQIANGGNLFWFAQAVNGGEGAANAVLTADIDLESRQWVPIQGYTGTFDGAGHSISGFAITEYNSATLVVGSKMYLGLFGYIESPAVVKNFNLSGRIALNEGGSTAGYLGAAVAASGQDNQHNGGTITGITSNVTLITGAGYTLSHGGGVAGALYGGSISQCIFTGSLSSNGGSFNEVGGVVGYCQDTLIENCGFYGSVSVSGTTHAGGILGYVNNSGAIIRNNVSLGSVSGGNAQYVGAIIGRANSNCAAANGYNNYYSTVNVLYGIGSGSEGMSNDTAATSMPTEAFYSGEVTWLLNEEGEGVWTQSLTGDSLPGFSGDAVYYWNVYDCAGNVLSQVYTNTPTDGTIPDHTLDENGLCSVCGLQHEALVTLGTESRYYATLQEALTKAQEGTEENRALVKVLVDVNLTTGLTMTGGYATLDLNGHEVWVDAGYSLWLYDVDLIFRDTSEGQTGVLQNDYYAGNGLQADQGSYVELQSGTIYALNYVVTLNDGSEILQTGGKLGWGAVAVTDSRYTMEAGEITDAGIAATSKVDSGAEITIRGGSITATGDLFYAYGNVSLTVTGGTFVNPNGSSRVNRADSTYPYYSPVITLQGGTFQGGLSGIDSSNGNIPTPLTTLLAQGYALKAEDGSWITLTEDQSEVAQTVTVAQAPMYITKQPQDVTMQTTDAVRISIVLFANDAVSDYTYQWFREGEAEAVGTYNVLELVALEAGTYQYYCVVTHADTGYQVVSQTATVTVTECSHSLDGNACCTLCGKQMAASLTAGDQTTYYPQAWVALHKANETPGSIVTLLTDIDCEDWSTTITGTMTLDLNGKTWTLQQDYFDLSTLRAYTLSIDGGTLTIRDSLGGGKLTSSDRDYTVRIVNAGKVILEGGTIENTANGSAVYMEQSSFTQTGGGLIAGSEAAIYAENSQLSLEGGSTQGIYALFAMSSTVSVTGGTHTGAVLLGMSEGTITGGTFYPPSVEGLNVSLIPLESNLAITGGSFPQGIYATDFDGVPVPLAPVLAEGYAFYQNGTPVTLTEGQSSIAGNVTVALCSHILDGEGLCGVCGQQFVASVTADGQTTYCAQLSQAIRLANEASEAVITLLTSFTPEDTLDAITGTVTLELNGKTCSADAEYLLKVSGGSLTIRDSLGGGKLLASTESGGTVWILSGDLTLESGTIEQDLDEWGFAVECLSGRFTQTGGALVSNGDALYGGSTSQISIQGGSLQGYYRTFTLNANASVTLSGGSFPKGIQAANNSSEPIPLAPMLAEGYCFRTSDGSCTVSTTITSLSGSVTVVPVPWLAINEINFPDDDFRDYVSETCDSADDTNSPGYLTDEELLAVTEIDVSGSNIYSLEGVEHFTALTSLVCYNNSLNALDVSHNTALTTLNCGLNKLSVLDVSNNTALTVLSCYSNGLSALDVSHNPALEILNCVQNSLESLDVSGNGALKELECRDNQLSSLDVSHNPALEVLRCYNNKIAELDVSANEALTVLNCDDNELKTLDVSRNTALTELDCDGNGLKVLDVSNNTALRRLACGDNELTELDVSANTGLEYLYCNNNALTTLDASNNTKLIILQCNNNGSLATLVLPETATLQRLYCYHNALTTLDVSGNSELERLYCYNNALKELDVSQNPKLTSLLCRNNQISTLDLSGNTALVNVQCENNHLTALDLSQQTLYTFSGGGQTTQLTLSGDGTADFTPLGDTSRMTVTSGGTLENGIVTPEEGATQIVYTYTTGNSKGNLEVTVTLVEMGTISVDITWGQLDFTYDPGIWNPESLTYTGGSWQPTQEGGNAVTVENIGSVAVNVTVAYTAAADYAYISGSFTEAGAYLAAQEQKKFYLLLTGKPQSDMNSATLGTVTVTIGGE